MRLLIVTQAVDAEDPILGFFLRWIEGLAAQVDYIEVVCLKEGRHALPQNVRVHSLGKECGAKSRVAYIFRFVSLVWRLRYHYDAVFVHMNEEYMLLAGLFWRLSGKRIIFWRNHRMGSWRTRIAMILSSAVCHTSPEAFVSRSSKAVLMPVGIDTEMFSLQDKGASESSSVLFIGRLDPVKRVEEFVEAVSKVSVLCKVDLYGSPTEPDSAYSRLIALKAQPLVERGVLTLYPAVPHDSTPGLYRAHAVYVNLTPSGSLDKTIGEAMASGCVVVCANDAVRQVVRPELMVNTGDPREVAQVLERATGLSREDRFAEVRKLRAHIEQHHSLDALIRKIAMLLRQYS
ncbi:MAG: glycosyltransferase family 4 protein [bacterium]|nr:glycosyltransferase family 4 protein [bacterium]MDO8742403.1 glycosyltransferase family 4 protein [bacterium]